MLEPTYYIISAILGIMLIYYLLKSHKLEKIIDEEDDSEYIHLSDKELETLIECVDYHIDMLEQATGRAQSKEMRARFLLTKNTMLDIRKKLEEK